MATVVTRSIGGTKDRKDRVAIKVDKETYAEKWGLISVNVASYYPTTGGSTVANAGKLTIKAPNYNEDCDFKVLDEDTVASNTYNSGSPKTVDVDYHFAVNNGVPGPSVRQNPDGSWDLLDVYFEQPEDNALSAHTVTVTYTVAFDDETP
jgi:hypothetical protein